MTTTTANPRRGRRAGPGARPRHHPLRRRLRRRHAAGRHPVHAHVRRLRQRHQHAARTSPPRSAPRPARWPASAASRSSFSSQRHLHARATTPDVLVAMNPAALKTNLEDLPRGRHPDRQRATRSRAGNLEQGRLRSQPARGRLAQGLPRLRGADHHAQRARRSKDCELTAKQVDRCKNFFALGLMFWLYERPLEPTLEWIDEKFGKNPSVAEANTARPQGRLQLRRNDRDVPHALPRRQGEAHARAATARSPATRRRRSASSPRRSWPDGRSFYGSYPITPATRHPARARRAARTSACTPSRPRTRSRPSARRSARRSAARSGMTGTSGPGIALKSEAIGLAVMIELPLVIIDVQRGGPSTGLPTKTEQADLLQVHVRPQRRIARRHRRAGHAGRLLRHGASKRGASRSST